MAKKLKLSDLQQDPSNLNLGTERGRNVIKQSLAELGAGRSILVDKNGYIIAGNKTAAAALDAGIEDVVIVETTGDRVVVVQRTDLDLSTDPKAKKLAVTDNRASELGLNWDIDALKVVADEIDISWLFTDEEIEGLDGWEDVENLETEGLTDKDEIPDPEDVETRVKKGDIWRLGRHRVMCGDSTVITDVERLMDGEKADLCFTSPPYNAGENSHINGDYYKDGGKKTFYEDHSKDTMSSADYILFCNIVLQNLFFVIKQKGSVLWNTAYNANSRKEYGEIVFGENNPFSVQETIVWDKTSCFNISSKNILSRVCEFVFLLSSSSSYFTNQGDNEPWYNVWRISSTGSSHGGHRACFPVALPEKGIECFCPKDGLIIEPFLGSGSTLIAAEKTGRTCYGMELSEKYCDVILKRWEDFTGQTAERI